MTLLGSNTTEEWAAVSLIFFSFTLHTKVSLGDHLHSNVQAIENIGCDVMGMTTPDSGGCSLSVVRPSCNAHIKSDLHQYCKCVVSVRNLGLGLALGSLGGFWHCICVAL